MTRLRTKSEKLDNMTYFSSEVPKSPRFILDFIRRGLLYALANERIHRSIPLDPQENWHFWTDSHPYWLELLAKRYPPEPMRKIYLDFMLQQRNHASGIEAHYDISNQFYALFLDNRYRFYSCAEFKSDDETLEQAQENKAAQLCHLLDLRGNEKVLDLGCGWGAMLKYLQDSGHEGELKGFTLSKEQLTYIKEQLGFKVSLTDFITEPWGDVLYERIISMGALEHVRPQEIETTYQKIYDALVPGGKSVHQFFSLENEPFPTSMIMVQLFFPGSLLVMHSTHLETAQKVGFRITHDSVHDYQPTLQAWYERLVQNEKLALELVELEVYNRYLTFFPISWLFFARKEANLHRIVLEKPV